VCLSAPLGMTTCLLPVHVRGALLVGSSDPPAILPSVLRTGSAHAPTGKRKQNRNTDTLSGFASF
jgi:hypothetical protein